MPPLMATLLGLLFDLKLAGCTLSLILSLSLNIRKKNEKMSPIKLVPV